MITWMQKHRKYLVITLWISTFAFVGAGFVGWGQYNYNTDKNSAVAMVGKEKVTVKSFQKAYQNYFYYENEQRKGTYTQEQAKKDGLQEQVIEALINNALLLNYAKELGLSALDIEVKDKLRETNAFQKEGTFNKEQYYLVMKNTQQKAAAYEKDLENDIIIEKLRNLISLPATELETKMMYAAQYLEDTVGIKTLSLENEVTLVEDEIKGYWEAHKNDYMTSKSYDVEMIDIPLSDVSADEAALKTFFDEHKFDYKTDEGKLDTFEHAKASISKDYAYKMAKKTALKTYLSFKKDKIKATKKMTILATDMSYDVEKLASASISDVLKPMKTDTGYAVLKLMTVTEPTAKSYEDAKSTVQGVVKMQKTQKALEDLAKQTLASAFDYDTKVVVSKDKMQIEGVNPFMAMQLVQKIFASEGKGYVVTAQNAIVFDILEQKLLPESYSSKKVGFVDNVAMTKANLLNNAFINNLRKKYKIEKF